MQRRRKLQLILLALVVIGIIGCLPRIRDLDDSWRALQQASLPFIIVAVIVVFLSYAASAFTYTLLAMHRIKFRPTLVVELAGLLINRVLPAGLGGLSLNYTYLRQRRHAVAEASAVVALNNGLGIVGHLLLLIIVVLVTPWRQPQLHFSRLEVWLSVGLLGALLLGALGLLRRRNTLLKQLRQLSVYYWQRPSVVTSALLTSMMVTLLGVMTFWLSVHAITGPQLSFSAAYIVFTASIITMTATPTPGGLGGAEAALFIGLIGYKISAPDALTAVLLYRSITFWLGLGIGVMAAALLRRLKIIQFKF